MLFSWVTQLFSKPRTNENLHKPSKKASRRQAAKQRNSSTKGRTSKQLATAATSANVAYAYRAVSVYSRTDCCEASARLESQKFLAAHAPTLPLGGCTQAAHCRCRYKHYQDRRQDVRRDADHGLPGQYVANNRRYRRDRRKPQTSGGRVSAA